jgi:hypothetical protein
LGRKTCKIEDIEYYYYQIFSFPESKIKYYTKTGLFELNGESVSKEDVRIEFVDQSAILIVNGSRSAFKDNDSCFHVLKFINILHLPDTTLSEASNVPEYQQQDLFNFYPSLTIEDGKITKKSDFRAEGLLDLTSLYNIRLVSLPHIKFNLRRYEIKKSFPVYQKYYIYFEIFNVDNIFYSFYVNFGSEEHFKRMRDRLLKYTSCSFGKLLNYYKKIDLQNNMEDNLDGNNEAAKFTLKNVYREINESLDNPINIIYIYDIQYGSDEDKTAEDKTYEINWLIIKGINGLGKFNK